LERLVFLKNNEKGVLLDLLRPNLVDFGKRLYLMVGVQVRGFLDLVNFSDISFWSFNFCKNINLRNLNLGCFDFITTRHLTTLSKGRLVYCFSSRNRSVPLISFGVEREAKVGK
jgi:hypothetical protein